MTLLTVLSGPGSTAANAGFRRRLPGSKPAIGSSVDGGSINGGLVAWWPMLEGGGGKVSEVVNREPVALIGSPKWGAAPHGGSAIVFDGVDDAILLSNESLFDFEYTQPFSISFWFKLSDIAAVQGSFIRKTNDSTTHGWYLTAASGSGASCNGVTFGMTSDAPGYIFVTAASDSLVANRWYHCAAVYQGGGVAGSGGMTIYLDGVKANDSGSGGTSLSGTCLNNLAVAVGARAGGADGRFLSGAMSDLRVWRRALSAAESLRLFLEPFFGLSRPFRYGAVINITTESLEGAIDGVSTVAGDLRRTRSLAGSVAASSSVAAELLRSRSLAGAVSASSTVDGGLNAQLRTLAGTIAANSSLVGAIGGNVKELEGTIAASSSLVGALVAIADPISGGCAATSSVVGDLSLGVRSLAGSIVSSSVVAANLSGGTGSGGGKDLMMKGHGN